MHPRIEALVEELDLWGEAGIHADLWWRDDDASAPRVELQQILDLSQDLQIPLHLAVIPAQARADLLAGAKAPILLRVLQHGWSHANHERGRAMASELGSARPAEEVLTEIAAGIHRLIELFGNSCVLPVLVPPWNSISSAVVESLDSIGIRGISRLGARKSLWISSGVVQINTHVDITSWRRKPPCFIGWDKALSLLVKHLRARREGRADADEPTGILTHHWVSDACCWEFLRTLGCVVKNHPAARWVSLDWYHAR